MRVGKKENNEPYIHIERWMSQALNIKGNELIIFALIYGMTVNSSSQRFFASSQYIEDFIGCSAPTALNALKNLTNRGYVKKTSKPQEGFIVYNSYEANIEFINNIKLKYMKKNG